MLDKNIEYRSAGLVDFYSCNRDSWSELYPSERKVFKKVFSGRGTLGRILDVGCACGGLGAALSSEMKLESYTGVDINRQVIEWAEKNRRLAVRSTFIKGDIVSLKLKGQYDTVVSLSCADWNIETERIVKACWAKVKKGGYFIISLRLAPDGKGINDIGKSYQYIKFYDSQKEPEIANYVVFGLKEIMAIIKKLSPGPVSIGAYGYFGKPSKTAVTPFKRLVFAVFYIRKGSSDKAGRSMDLSLDLPSEIFNQG